MSDPFPPEIRFQAFGQAAMMMLEGVLLDLVEKDVLNAQDLIETVDAVVETKRQILLDGSEDEVATCAIGMLVALGNTILTAQRSKKAGLASPDRI